MVASYDFDATEGDLAFADTSGRGHLLQTFTSNGATLRTMPRGTGRAVVFPAVCTAATGCPKMVLQTADAADLNPGASPVRYGASVLLAADQTTGGQNVLQKGYSGGGGQYKLQIDSLAGRPSCVLVDRNVTTIHLAKSAVAIADGNWHRVECHRSGGTLTVLVDGSVTGTVAVPAELSVVNSAPLVIGGKGISNANDQFHGALDDVSVSIG